jgi:hypothetical protein
LPPPQVPSAGLVDFANNSVVALADFILDDVVGTVGPFGINDLIGQLTNGTGTWALPKPLLPEIVIPVLTDYNLTFGVVGLDLDGLNSWTSFDLLRPEQKYDLRSVLDLGSFGFGLDFLLNITSATGCIYCDKGTVSLDMSGNKLVATLMVLLNETKISSLVNDPTQVLVLFQRLSDILIFILLG